MPIHLLVLLSFHSQFRFCFRHALTYSSIIQEHTDAYSEPSVSLEYPKPWHIPITKHIQTIRYIHSNILNILTKAQSCSISSKCTCLLQTLSNFQSNFAVSLRLCFRHIQSYSRIIQPYLVLLRHIKSAGIFRDTLLQPYSGILHTVFRHSGTYSCILRHIQNTWLIQAIFRTRDIFSQFQAHYSGITQEQKTIAIFGISSLEFAEMQKVVQNKKIRFGTKNALFGCFGMLA